MSEEIAKAVRRALASVGNIGALAADAGVSAPSLWAWAGQRRRPRPENLRNLAAALDRRGAELAGLSEQLLKLAEELER
jgi:transcriptional regulator with XRE-family HTH domain